MTLTTAGAFGPRRGLHPIALVLGGVLFTTGSVLAGDLDCTAGHFANPEFAAGEGACAVALGDLNADGAVDAVVANRYGALVPPGSSGNGTISVLLNNGDRTMAGQIVYPAGSYPWSLVLADLDGDGDLDLAVSDQQNDNVLVLFNDGNAGFTPGATYPVGDFGAQIVSGDLDGDGDPDLAVTCRVPNAVSILLNNGNGTFAAAFSVPAGADPRALAIADLDGDGDLDLATANWTTNNVSVLKNNGNASFGAPSNFAAGNGTLCIAAGDLNGDGDADLAVGNYTSDNFTILSNNGSGSFTPAGAYAAGTGKPMAVSLADLDEDGDLDIAAPSQNSQTVAVLWNNGSAAFATATLAGASATPTGLAVGDLDGDSHLDIAVGNFFGNNLSLIFGGGGGTFGINPALAAGGSGPRQVELDDLDGDGNLDIACATFTSNAPVPGGHAITLRMGNGDGTFAGFVLHPCNLSSNGPQAIASGDLNGDGHPDLAIAYETGMSAGVMLNNGNGTFGPDTPYGHNLPIDDVWANDVALGDLDGDGDLDLVSGGQHLAVNFNNGNGTFAAEVAYGPFYGYSIQLEDVDGDGDLDIAGADIVAVYQDGLLTIWHNNGSGVFGAPTSYNAGNFPGSIAFGDVDGDGDRDVLVANWFSGDLGTPHVSIMEKNANGDYAIASTVDADQRCRYASFADVDEDSDLDIVVSNGVGDNVSVALNDGDGTFADSVQYGAGDGNWSHDLGDVNNDGHLDIITADWLANTVSVLLNECVDSSETCPADIAPPGAGNGTVNISDLLAVISAWGPCNNCSEDVAPQPNGNNQVNIEDLLFIISAWGPCR